MHLVYNWEYRLIIGNMAESWPQEKKKATKALRFGSFLSDISFGSPRFSQNYECTRESCLRLQWLPAYPK